MDTSTRVGINTEKLFQFTNRLHHQACNVLTEKGYRAVKAESKLYWLLSDEFDPLFQNNQ